MIHEKNITQFDQAEINKIYIFAESHQYERVVEDVLDYGRDYSSKIGFLVANMSNLDERAKLPVKWYKIKKFPAVYGQAPGKDKVIILHCIFIIVSH